MDETKIYGAFIDGKFHINEVYLGTRSIVGVENKTRKIPINADNQHNKIVKSRYNLNILGFMLPKW